MSFKINLSDCCNFAIVKPNRKRSSEVRNISLNSFKVLEWAQLCSQDWSETLEVHEYRSGAETGRCEVSRSLCVDIVRGKLTYHLRWNTRQGEEQKKSSQSAADLIEHWIEFVCRLIDWLLVYSTLDWKQEIASPFGLRAMNSGSSASSRLPALASFVYVNGHCALFFGERVIT